MIELPLIDFETLKSNLVGSDSFHNDILVSDLDEYIASSDKSVRVGALQFLLVLEGSIDLSLDYVTYKVEANMMVTIMPSHITQTISCSDNYKGMLIAVSRPFLEQTISPSHSSPMVQYMNIRKNPTILLDANEVSFVSDCFQRIKNAILNTDHHLQRYLIQNTLVYFFIEMGNIFLNRKEYSTPPSLSRKEELLDIFLRLLYSYSKEQHGVTFYADQLFITPQYLSLILKELTGKSANKWIDEALMQEAKILLKTPQTTVQQVAHKLHFSNQSTFGKFFKKHSGMSPLKYRKNSYTDN